nr:hypothetical protein [Paenibacillus bovis]
MSNFISKDKDIVRGYEYHAAIPYSTDTPIPLTFFIPDSSDPEKGILHN